MHGPCVVTWMLAVLAAASGGYCLTRLRASAAACGPVADRREAREMDAAEAAMGFGMAAMAVAPGPAWGWLYGLLAVASLFGAFGPRLGPVRPGRGLPVLRAHRLHHAIGALSMTYMALAMPSGGSMPMHHTTTAGLPLLTGALLLYFGCYALWAGRRLLTAQPGLATAGLPQACRVAMGIGMFAMLLTL